MKRYMEMAGGALGVVAFVTLVAILITLFQGQQAIHRILTWQVWWIPLVFIPISPNKVMDAV